MVLVLLCWGVERVLCRRKREDIAKGREKRRRWEKWENSLYTCGEREPPQHHEVRQYSAQDRFQYSPPALHIHPHLPPFSPLPASRKSAPLRPQPRAIRESRRLSPGHAFHLPSSSLNPLPAATTKTPPSSSLPLSDSPSHLAYIPLYVYQMHTYPHRRENCFSQVS